MRWIVGWGAIVVAMCGSLTTSGCASTATLKLVSVKVTDYSEQPEIPSPTASAFASFMTDQQMVRNGLANPYEKRPHRKLLKVEFSSDRDLKALMQDGFSIGSYATFCGESESPLSTPLSLVRIYQAGERLGSWSPRTGADTQEAYYVFLNVVWNATLPSKPPEQSFDLNTRAKDICLYVSGGKAPFEIFKSNTVLLSKQAIVDALATQK